MFRTMALNPSWKSRRKDIRVSGAKALFPFTTGYAVNARRRWGRACLKIHSRPKACKGKVRGKSEGNKRKDNGVHRMKDMTLSPEMKETVRKAQIDEETGAILYGYLGRKQKDEKNRKVFSQMSSDEKASAWQFSMLSTNGR